jgi:hypothetical protein
VVFYDNDEFPGIPDLGAMLGISLVPGFDPKYGYKYYAKDIYNAGGSNALSRYVSKLTAAGFYLGVASDTINIYANDQSGVRLSIIRTSLYPNEYITINIYHATSTTLK